MLPDLISVFGQCFYTKCATDKSKKQQKQQKTAKSELNIPPSYWKYVA